MNLNGTIRKLTGIILKVTLIEKFNIFIEIISYILPFISLSDFIKKDVNKRKASIKRPFKQKHKIVGKNTPTASVLPDFQLPCMFAIDPVF